jgi:oligo-1,6-glucosidase
VSRFGSDGVFRERSATALATVLHLQRGTPFIYQGEELGMTNVQFSHIDDFRDIESLNYFAEATAAIGADPVRLLAGMQRASRDNARTPVQWTSERHGGFTEGDPWIPVNANYAEVNAAEQRGREGSVLEYYRALIRLRHEERLVVDGRFRILAADDPTVFAFERVGDAGRLLVVANLSDEPRPHASLPAELANRSGDVLICNVPAPGGDELLPWEAWVRRS